MSYIIVRGHCCDIVLTVDTQREGITDDVKDSFDKESEHVFDKFPKYHITI
jgi:hypothetical protein